MEGLFNEKKETRVSVIIPCYNLGQYIKEAVDSVLNQTFQNFEIIIVDDGSTDVETLDILKKMSDPKVKIIYQKNGGVSSARNNGIAVANGKYICCLDADDKYHPEFLEKTVKVLDNDKLNKYGIVTTNFKFFENSSEKIEVTDYDKCALAVRNRMHTASLFRKECWQKVGGYRDGSGYEDWDFWVAIIAKGCEWFSVKDFLFFYRNRLGSRFKSADKNRVKNTIQVVKNNENFYLDNSLEIILKFIEEKNELLNYNAELLENKILLEQEIGDKERKIKQKDKELYEIRTSFRWKIPNYFYKKIKKALSVLR